MSSPADPTRAWRKRTAITWIAALPALLGVTWWAFSSPAIDPPPSLEDLLDHSQIPAGGAAEPPSLARLDLDAFNIDLWPAPTQSAAEISEPEQPDTQPIPLRLQLIGIVSEPAPGSSALVHKAALYNPDTDEILIVASGEKIGAHTVSSIEQKSVVLASANREQTLYLRPDLEDPRP